MSQCDISITVIPRSIDPASTWKFILLRRETLKQIYLPILNLFSQPLSQHIHKAFPRAFQSIEETFLIKLNPSSSLLTTQCKKTYCSIQPTLTLPFICYTRSKDIHSMHSTTSKHHTKRDHAFYSYFLSIHD